MDLLITTFQSRKIPRGKLWQTNWDKLCTMLSKPKYTDESIEEYAAMSNEAKTDVKDVGGFVGGELTGGRRSKAALQSRCIVTIDADYASLDDPDNFKALYPYVFCCHTTHTSTNESPRLRWVFPLKRTVTADEYRIIAGVLGSYIGVETLDDSTDQPERLMFWPSASWDADFHFWDGGNEVLDPDELLSSEEAKSVQSEIAAAKEGTVEEHITDGQLEVAEGHRNKMVFSFAAGIRHLGIDNTGLGAMVRDYNERYCSPPLEDWEVDTIVRSVMTRYAPGEAVNPTLRDAWEDFSDLGEYKPPEAKKTDRLHLESAASLMARDVKETEYVVPGLIPHGQTLLCSPPKFGKSWLALDLAISVATGTPVLGRPTNKCGVLYLALEDGDARLKKRLRQVANGREIPQSLYFVKEAPTLDGGLVAQVDKALESCGDVGMVIIDTLQKVRGTAGKTEGVYGYDYRELGALQHYAQDRGIANVIVHHLNKGGDGSDFVNQINGSTGVTGAADVIITLTRKNRKDKLTYMNVTGRDVQEFTNVIMFDKNTFRWEDLGDADEYNSSDSEDSFDSDVVAKTVCYLMDEAEDMGDEDMIVVELTSGDLKAECERLYGPLEESAVWVGRRVTQFVRQFEKVGISYEYKRTNSKRLHSFVRERI